MTLQIEYPEELATLLGPDPAAAVREAVLLQLVHEGKMSVARAGQLLGLARDDSIRWYTGHGYLLRKVADVVLAPAVVEELRAGVGKPGSRVPDLPWIEARVPAEGDMDEVLRALDAHAGEQETVALAMGGTIEPVIDEGPDRRYVNRNREQRFLASARGCSSVVRSRGLDHRVATSP